MCIRDSSEIEEVLHDSPSPAVIIALIIAILFVTALQAGFWFLLAKVLFHFARKQIMRNNSFITVEYLDYYRDKPVSYTHLLITANSK